MFLQNKACYDLLCQVDVGKLSVPKNPDLPYEKETYYKVDQDFINSLIFRIRQNSINDADIRMAFTSYTRLMLDIAVGNLTTLKHNGRDIAQLFATRADRLRKSHIFKTRDVITRAFFSDQANGISLGYVEQKINQLRLIENMSSQNEVRTLRMILSDILKYAQSTEENIAKVMYLLPKEKNGLQPIAMCLFAES